MESQKDIQKVDLNNCAALLQDSQKCLAIFCQAMLDCHPFHSEDDQDFKDLSNAVTLDAITYFKAVQPITKQVIQKIDNFFENVLTGFQDIAHFIKSLPMLKNQLDHIVFGLGCVHEMHSMMMSHVISNSITASNLLDTLKKKSADLQRRIDQLDTEARTLEEKAKTLMNPWFFLLHAIPIVGGITQIGMEAGGIVNKDKAKDLRNQEDNLKTTQGHYVEAIDTVKKHLTPGLVAYSKSISDLLNFFSAFNLQLESILDEVKNADDMAKVAYNNIKAGSLVVCKATSQSLAYYDHLEKQFNGFMDKNMLQLWQSMCKGSKLPLIKDLRDYLLKIRGKSTSLDVFGSVLAGVLSIILIPASKIIGFHFLLLDFCSRYTISETDIGETRPSGGVWVMDGYCPKGYFRLFAFFDENLSGKGVCGLEVSGKKEKLGISRDPQVLVSLGGKEVKVSFGADKELIHFNGLQSAAVRSPDNAWVFYGTPVGNEFVWSTHNAWRDDRSQPVEFKVFTS